MSESSDHKGTRFCGIVLYAPMISLGVPEKAEMAPVLSAAGVIDVSDGMDFVPKNWGKTILVKKFMKMKMPTVLSIELRTYNKSVSLAM